MVFDRRLRTIAFGAVLLLGPAPSFAEPSELPDLGPSVIATRLPSGGLQIVRPVQGAPLAAIELWFRAPSTGFGLKPALGIARLAAQVVAGSKPILGPPLGKAVNDAGGRLSVSVYTDSVAVSAIVPTAAARDIIKAMTTAYFAPVTTEEAYRAAQRDVSEEALIASLDPEAVVRDAVFEALFTSGPQHYSALGAPKDVTALTFADVKAFATRAFRAGNATLVVSGAVDGRVGEAAVAGRAADAAAGGEAPAVPTLASAPQPVEREFNFLSGGYGWTGPPIADQREATAMDFIADYLFRPDGGSVSKQIAQQYPDAFFAGHFITLYDPGVMLVSYATKNVDGIRALVEAGVASVQKPLERGAFAAALEAFKYHILSDLQTPTEMADNYGWYSVEGSLAYAPGADGDNGPYFKAANALTASFVAGVASKYLSRHPVVVELRPPPKAKGKS